MSVEPLHSRPRCVICAENLEAGARKCTKCDSFQDVRECPSCAMPTPRHSARCIYCKFVEDGKPCRVCAASLPHGAIRCDVCSAFQNWRRWAPATQVTLALVLAIISVLTAVIPPIYGHFANRSNTHIRVIGEERFRKEPTEEEQPTIVVLVANNGRRPSLVKSARLTFGKSIHVTGAELEALDKDVLVMPNAPRRMHFTGPMLGRSGGKSKQDVRDEVQAGHDATLTVTVEETNRRGKPFDAFAPHTFKVDKIRKWMEAHVATH